MKKLIRVLFIALMLTNCVGYTSLQAYDFSSDYLGKTIYYNITSPSTVEVTHGSPYSVPDWCYYTGVVNIPTTVNYNSTTYTVTSIGKCAFAKGEDGLKPIIPNTVTMICDSAFWGYSSWNTSYSNDTIIIPSSVVKMGKAVFFGCLHVCNIIVLANVTNIDERTFCFCPHLKYISLPNTVTIISDNAFSNCFALDNVVLPNSLLAINSSAFYNCYSLKHIMWPTLSHFSIGNSSFKYCGFDTLYLPHTISSIGSLAFANDSSLKFINYDANCENNDIQNSWFNGCDSITNVVFGNNVNHICKNFLYGNKSIKKLIIPYNIKTIGVYAFSFCDSLKTVTFNAKNCNKDLYINNVFANSNSLTNIFIGDSVESLPNYFMADNTHIKEIDLNRNLKKIGISAFSNCSNLRKIILSRKINEINIFAFKSCYNLDTITYYSDVPATIDSSTFSDVNTNCNVFIPCGSFNNYMNTDYWNTFSNYQYLDYSYLNIDTTINNGDTLNLFGMNIFQNGVYCDTIYDSTACDSIITIHCTVGLNDMINTSNNVSMNIYPNPAKDNVNININNIFSPYIITIYDLQGKKIKSLKVNNQQKNISLPISSFSKGFYTINLSAKGINIGKKLIIE